MNPAILSSPWAIEPAVLEEILERCRAQAGAAAPGALGAIRPKARGEYALRGGVAIVAVEGVLMRRPGFFDALFGAESTEDLQMDIAAALDDPAVKGIVLDVNSPGGTVDGTQELASAVHQANARKPVAALANGLMASAAYWIGAAADSVWISSDTARVGSIGVLTTHYDLSAREQMLGVKATDVYAGKYKAIGSPHAPLSAEGRGTMQEQVDYLYSVFINDVARNRGVPAAIARDKMGEGRVFIGEQAISAGLIDGQASLAELVGRMNGGTLWRRRAAPGGAGAAAQPFHVDRPAQSFEERCKGAWDADANLRGEYAGDFRAYMAWERVVADGRVSGHGYGGNNG